MHSSSSSEILWTEILCRIPFIKQGSTADEEMTVRIDSKNEVKEEDALQLEQEILKQQVILSHSITWPPQLHWKGFVEDFKYEHKNIQVTVSSREGFSIWEDADIWMYLTPTSSSHDPSLDPLDPLPEVSEASGAPEGAPEVPETPGVPESPEKTEKDASEMSQSEIFESINGWMLMGQKRQRKRRKDGEKWKNVYLTEFEMQTLDPMKRGLMEYVKKGTALRFSDNIDEAGDVLMDVLRKNESSTITLGVTGFTSPRVDILLSKESTYYLSIYDEEDDEDAISLASEDYILPGYPLEQNLDELCEKIGQLTITNLCVKSWLNPTQNVPYIRLLVSSERPIMKHFKILTGHHVTIQSTVQTTRQTVLAVVSRVLREEMVLTLKGVPKGQQRGFFFSKTERITIQIDHNFEERIQKSPLETLRWNFIREEMDIRLYSKWKDEKNCSFVSFTTRNEAFTRIPLDTVVLLSKCWEVEGSLEQKVDFIFGVRVDNSLCKYSAPNTNQVTFEIKNYRNQVEESKDFIVSKAFYYIDFTSLSDVLQSKLYTRLNVRCQTTPSRSSYPSSSLCIIPKSLKFYVYPLEAPSFNHYPKTDWKQKQTPKRIGGGFERMQPLRIPEKKMEEEMIPEDPKISPRSPEKKRDIHLEKEALHRMIDSREPLKVLSQIDHRHRRLCYVYIQSMYRERGDQMVKLTTNVKGENGEKVNDESLKLKLGLQIVVTPDEDHKDILMKGDVFDTREDTVSIKVDHESSDMGLIKRIASSKQRLLLPLFTERRGGGLNDWKKRFSA